MLITTMLGGRLSDREIQLPPRPDASHGGTRAWLSLLDIHMPERTCRAPHGLVEVFDVAGLAPLVVAR